MNCHTCFRFLRLLVVRTLLGSPDEAAAGGAGAGASWEGWGGAGLGVLALSRGVVTDASDRNDQSTEIITLQLPQTAGLEAYATVRKLLTLVVCLQLYWPFALFDLHRPPTPRHVLWGRWWR